MPNGRMRWRKVRVLAPVLMAGALMVGCGDGDGGGDDAPATTEAPSTSSGGDTTTSTSTSAPTTSTSTADPAVRPTVPPVTQPSGFDARPLEPGDPTRGAGPTTVPGDPRSCTPEPGLACPHDGTAPADR